MKARQKRIETLDVVRGVAICGILLVTIGKMGSLTDPAVDGFPAHLSPAWIAWGLQTLFVDGAMRGLFTMLFGAGMLLMLRRAEGQNAIVTPIDVWARRSLALMALGIILWIGFLWPGEILWNYGVSGFFLLGARTMRPRPLLLSAAALLTALSLYAWHDSYAQAAQLRDGRIASTQAAAGLSSDADARAAVAAVRANETALHPSDQALAERRAERTHLRTLLRWSEHFWVGENISGSGWFAVAESVAFMMIGMALFRLGVLTGDAPTSVYRTLALVGYATGIAGRAVPLWLGWASDLDMASPVVTPGWWAASAAMFEPFRLMMTVGHLGLIVLLWRSGLLGRAVGLRALGRMALTTYVLQATIGSILFYGFGEVGRFDLAELWAIAVAIWIATAMFSRWWLGRFDMGPIERLLRLVAYGWGEHRDGDERPSIAGCAG